MAADGGGRGVGGGGDPAGLLPPLGELTCPWCGAAVEEDALQCPACTGPLRVDEPVEGDPDLVLPPLPDGGLAGLMPAWLRDEQEDAGEGVAEAVFGVANATSGLVESQPDPDAVDAPDADAPTAADLGSRATLAETPIRVPVDAEPLLTEADLPAWLLALAVRQGGGPAAIDGGGMATVGAAARGEPLFLPDAPLLTAADLVAARPAAEPRPPGLAAASAESGPDLRAPEPAPARDGSGWVAVAVLLVLLAVLTVVAVAAGVWPNPLRP